MEDNSDTGKSLTLSDANNWEGEFTALSADKKYTVEEITPTGYTPTYTYGDDGYSVSILNSHTPETITVSGVKTWDDNDDEAKKRPSQITVNLLADGTQIKDTRVSADASGNWTYSFADLPAYKDGKKITYSITEDAVLGYKTEYDDYNIKNTYVSPTYRSISVSKVWDDDNDRDGVRPNHVTVHLYKNGTECCDPISLCPSNNWTGTFGVSVTYGEADPVFSITEDEVTGYEDPKIKGNDTDGYKITNKHTPETVTVKGTKEWDDNNDSYGVRPYVITLNLLANGVKVDTLNISTTGDTQEFDFGTLAKYENGEKILYTVTEEAVDKYTTKITRTESDDSGETFKIVNKYDPDNTFVNITEIWDDENDRDGLRPSETSVELLADDEWKEGVTVKKDDYWTTTVSNLPKNDTDGKEIAYSISINEITGYTSYLVNNSNGGNSFTIVNVHKPETKDIKVTKVWDDNTDTANARPSEIEINLLADGIEVESVEVKADDSDNWTYTFKDVPVTNDGKTITYTVTEDAVPNYSTTVKATDDGFTITNKYSEGNTSLSVSKIWDDANDADGYRSSSVKVQLLSKYGDKNWAAVEGRTLTLSSGNSWTDIFTELPMYFTDENTGTKYEYSYSVEEVMDDNLKAYYTSGISGSMLNGYTITNTHILGYISISGSKTWEDTGYESRRPSSITIRLYADGEQVLIDNVVPDADGKWQWKYEGLRKSENGKDIVYTIKEDTVPGYKTTINGYNVTNRCDDYVPPLNPDDPVNPYDPVNPDDPVPNTPKTPSIPVPSIVSQKLPQTGLPWVWVIVLGISGILLCGVSAVMLFRKDSERRDPSKEKRHKCIKKNQA